MGSGANGALHFCYPGLAVESHDGEIERVEVDDDRTLLEQLCEDVDDDETYEMLRAALLRRMVETDDARAPLWLLDYLERRGYLEQARDICAVCEPWPSEADFARSTNPRMVEGNRR